MDWITSALIVTLTDTQAQKQVHKQGHSMKRSQQSGVDVTLMPICKLCHPSPQHEATDDTDNAVALVEGRLVRQRLPPIVAYATRGLLT